MTADGHGKYFISRAESLAAICIYHQEAAREAAEALRKTEMTEPLCLYFVLKYITCSQRTCLTVQFYTSFNRKQVSLPCFVTQFKFI